MLRHFLHHWRRLVLVVIPLAFLPLIVSSSTQISKCAYSIILMAVFWITEALPLAVTALLPIVLFPVFGIMSTNEVCITYLKETNMMFLGGLMVAVAVEESGLHLRLALRVLLFVGSSPRWIMLGFMVTTAFLSMWINNTATTAMMVPIIDAVMEQLMTGYKKSIDNSENGLCRGASSIDSGLADSQITLSPIEDSKMVEIELKELESHEVKQPQKEENQDSVNFDRLRIGFLLATAYASNIGGTGALNGTAPNLVLKGVVEQVFGSQTGLNFATFTLFTFPTMIVCVVVAWLWLQVNFIRPLFCSRQSENAAARGAVIRRVIREKYEELGRITFHEIEVLILFFVLVLLWLLRDPKFIDGWQVYFPLKKVQDATVVMAIVILLFALPATAPWKPITNQDYKSSSAVTWKSIHEKLPWNVILLIGGGFALAEASKVSGLSKWIGHQLVIFKGLPPWSIVTVICLLTGLMTEVASNTATATIILPVLADMSKALRIHPLYTMLPAAVACSYAFSLPIGTPPNAIVFANARMKTTDMMVPGVIMNLLCVGIMTLMINTLGVYMFDLNHFPDWAEDFSGINATSTPAN